MILGYQVSSVKPHLTTADEVWQSFRKLWDIGYRDVQLQWIAPQVADEAVAEALSGTGLRCIAVQDRIGAVRQEGERFLRQNRLWGSRYMTVSGIPEDRFSPEGLAAYAKELRELAARYREYGVTLAFHPVTVDYRHVDGASAVDRLMDLLPGQVQVTLCLYHTIKAGLDPAEVLRGYRGRVDLIHCKDSIPIRGGVQLMPVGQGDTDWPPLLKACEEAGAKWLFAEQEAWQKDAFVCAKESFDYLSGLEYRAK